jgi:Fic-DOC domain mobile mystery protein B
MSNPLFEDEDAATTPLSPEEQAQLIPTYITTRDQLNEAEQQNITEADFWAFQRKRNVLTEDFLFGLHKRMFRNVWRWAGTTRTTERNIGIEAYRIGVELRMLLQDVIYWIDNKTFSEDEIALRLHHRLVFIHPFPNGNGRHARMAADLLAVTLGRPRFTWGRANLVEAAQTRKAYIAALKSADAHDLSPLIVFARS